MNCEGSGKDKIRAGRSPLYKGKYRELSEEELQTEFQKRLDSIGNLDEGAMQEALVRQDSRIKVPRSLGRLEDISIRMAGITGRVYGNEAKRQAIIIMSADNGVVEEGVASAPQHVTRMQAINFSRRITGVGAQAKYFGIDILNIDIGVKLDIPEELITGNMVDENGRIPRKIVDRRIRTGTRNMVREPAMTRREALLALMTGIEAADAAKEAGADIVGIGEMGIGNSTTAAAVICALTGLKAGKVIGRGGGLNNEGLAKKEKVVDEVVARYKGDDLTELVRSLSGLDICGMAGAFIGAASNRMPAVVDGYISIAAALIASHYQPLCKNYMFTSHRSHEPGYVAAVDDLGIEPMFDLGMKLGEASGCPIAFKIIEAALAVMNGMKSFEEGSINDSYLDEVREKNYF